jgi:hypothetical protein
VHREKAIGALNLVDLILLSYRTMLTTIRGTSPMRARAGWRWPAEGCPSRVDQVDVLIADLGYARAMVGTARVP